MMSDSPVMRRLFDKRRPQDWYPALDNLYRVAGGRRLGKHGPPQPSLPDPGTEQAAAASKER